MIQVEEYELKDGEPLTDDIVACAGRQDDTKLSHYSEANTYKLSEFDDIDYSSIPYEGIKLICDVNFLIDVTDESDLNPFYDGIGSDRWVMKFNRQDGDYILYCSDAFVYLVRDNMAYYIGGGCGSESDIQELEYSIDYCGDMQKPYSLLDFKEEYPFVVI